VRNSILRGDGFDVDFAPTGVNSGGANTVQFAHSSLRPDRIEKDKPEDQLTDLGGNLTVEPQLVDLGVDFHQLPGSPTIDAGQPSMLLGSTDLDGEQRVQGAAPDIGADEAVPVAPPPPPARDTDPPLVTEASLSARLFRVAPGATPVAARRKRSKLPAGTRVRYRLSEPAGVLFTIERVLPGRRATVRDRKRCVKPRRSLRRKRRCKRYVRAGVLRRSGALGPNRLRFTGRIGREALRPGSYRLTIVAIDPAGNTSAPRRLAFRVARRRSR
jgi:hypothetical protein